MAEQVPIDECDACGNGYPEDQLLKDLGEQQCASCSAGELHRRIAHQGLSVAFRQRFYDILFPGGRPLEQHITEVKGVVTADQARRWAAARRERKESDG